eukprot:7382201-Prymnesium_polylepis.2
MVDSGTRKEKTTTSPIRLPAKSKNVCRARIRIRTPVIGINEFESDSRGSNPGSVTLCEYALIGNGTPYAKSGGVTDRLFMTKALSACCSVRKPCS